MTTAGKRQPSRKKAPLTPEQLAAVEKAALIAAEEKEAKRQRLAAEKAEAKRRVAAEKEATKQQLAAIKKQAAAAEKEQQRIAAEQRLAKLPKIILDQILSQAKPDAGQYPALLAELRSTCPVSDKELTQVLKSLEASKTIVKCNTVGQGQANGKGFALAADVDSAAAPLLNTAFLLLRASVPRATKKSIPSSIDPDTAFSSSDLAAALVTEKASKAAFSAAIERAADQGRLSSGIAWVRIKGTRYFFQLDDLKSAPNAPPASDQTLRSNSPSANGRSDSAVVGRPQPLPNFSAAFDAAYDRVRQTAPKFSQLTLRALREALPQFSRAEFDAGLRELRSSERYTLESNEGGTGGLTQADRDAGVVESGSILVYVARR